MGSLKLNRQRGKRTERKLAKRLNAKRVGILGKEDLSHPVFSIEVKSRAKFAGESFLRQAERTCERGKTPLAVVHIRGKKISNSIVLMRLKDFEDYLGKILKLED